MARANRITIQDEPDWVRTKALRRRWRRDYTIALLAHFGLSTRFIADAFGEDDGWVRQIRRSEKTSLFRFPKVNAP